MANLPYVWNPGSIDRALVGIKAAATPTTVSQDFVKTMLKILGGPGNQITSYLRKIGFAGSDGAPTEIYKRFRNSATEGQAAFEALKLGYKPLYMRNEFMHELPDDKLRGLIIEETGEEKDSKVVGLVVACIKALKKYAKPGAAPAEEKPPVQPPATMTTEDTLTRSERLQTLGMNLSYTINLNLPATSDPAVFNAIFKSLRENLLRDSNG